MVFKSIAIIGSGNVATNIAHALGLQENIQLGIYSPTMQHRYDLSIATKSILYNNLDETFSADLILICVPDNYIHEVVNQLPKTKKIAYSSGSVQLNTFSDHPFIGVFYPLQTFTKNYLIDLKSVPFFIEANNKQFENELVELATYVGQKVSVTSSEDRKQYHIAAVFINNFTNHLAYLAQNHLNQHNLLWDNMLPLLDETVRKIKTNNPKENQTGPARRNDSKVIEQHLNELSEYEKNIYLAMTNSIKNTYHD